uniref:CSON004355 protein n=1 Tax=Culicoides sonorensis TaxID=179676 RepID=A0A336LTJ6_CULSO
MYNGIGLQTARGSGTNGHVQRNWAFIRPGKKSGNNFKTEEELEKLAAISNKQPNLEILDHERKRKIEVKCAELEDVLESQGLSSDEIQEKVTAYRKSLMNRGEDDRPKDKYGRFEKKLTPAQKFHRRLAAERLKERYFEHDKRSSSTSSKHSPILRTPKLEIQSSINKLHHISKVPQNSLKTSRKAKRINYWRQVKLRKKQTEQKACCCHCACSELRVISNDTFQVHNKKIKLKINNNQEVTTNLLMESLSKLNEIKNENLLKTMQSTSNSTLSVRETHQIAQAQQEKNAKLREAFGISEYFIEGTSFDSERKAKEELAKSEAIQNALQEKKDKELDKKYDLVNTPSPDKTENDEVNTKKHKSSKKKKKKSSSSTEKKKKSKKNKKEKSKKKSFKKSRHDSDSSNESMSQESSESSSEESDRKRKKSQKNKKSKSKKKNSKKRKHSVRSDCSYDSEDGSDQQIKRKKNEDKSSDKRDYSRSFTPKTSDSHLKRNRDKQLNENSFMKKEVQRSISPKRGVPELEKREKRPTDEKKENKSEKKNKPLYPHPEMKKNVNDNLDSSKNRRTRSKEKRVMRRSPKGDDSHNRKSVSPRRSRYDSKSYRRSNDRSRHVKRSNSRDRHNSSKRASSINESPRRLDRDRYDSRRKRSDKNSLLESKYSHRSRSRSRRRQRSRSELNKKSRSSDDKKTRKSRSPDQRKTIESRSTDRRNTNKPHSKIDTTHQSRTPQRRERSPRRSSISPKHSSVRNSLKKDFSKQHETKHRSSSRSLSYSPAKRNPERYRDILEEKDKMKRSVAKRTSNSRSSSYSPKKRKSGDDKKLINLSPVDNRQKNKIKPKPVVKLHPTDDRSPLDSEQEEIISNVNEEIPSGVIKTSSELLQLKAQLAAKAKKTLQEKKTVEQPEFIPITVEVREHKSSKVQKLNDSNKEPKENRIDHEQYHSHTDTNIKNSNKIVIKPFKIHDVIDKKQIAESFEREPLLNASQIQAQKIGDSTKMRPPPKKASPLEKIPRPVLSRERSPTAETTETNRSSRSTSRNSKTSRDYSSRSRHSSDSESSHSSRSSSRSSRSSSYSSGSSSRSSHHSSRSRSPSIPRRSGSPSFLDRRRITRSPRGAYSRKYSRSSRSRSSRSYSRDSRRYRR